MNEQKRRRTDTDGEAGNDTAENALQSLIEQIDEHSSQLDAPPSAKDKKKASKPKKIKKPTRPSSQHSHTMLYTSLLVMAASVSGLGFMWYQGQQQITSMQLDIKEIRQNMQQIQSSLKEAKTSTVSPTIPMTELLGRITPTAKQSPKKHSAYKKATTAASKVKTEKRKKISAPPIHPDTTWSVVIASHENREAARLKKKELAALGIQCNITDSIIRGQKWYRLETGSWHSADEAKKSLKLLEEKTHIPDLWIKKNPDTI